MENKDKYNDKLAREMQELEKYIKEEYSEAETCERGNFEDKKEFYDNSVLANKKKSLEDQLRDVEDCLTFLRSEKRKLSKKLKNRKDRYLAYYRKVQKEHKENTARIEKLDDVIFEQDIEIAKQREAFEKIKVEIDKTVFKNKDSISDSDALFNISVIIEEFLDEGAGEND